MHKTIFMVELCLTLTNLRFYPESTELSSIGLHLNALKLRFWVDNRLSSPSIGWHTLFRQPNIR